jgi:hypothetical protein
MAWVFTGQVLSDVVRGSLALDRDTFHLVQQAPWGLWVALGIVLLAGLSHTVGQSVVLFVNRVKRSRFLYSLLLFATLYTFGFLFWTLSIWLVGTQLFGRDASLRAVVQAVGVGYTPYLFSVFILTPYFGSLIAIALSLWSLLAILVAVQITLQLTLGQALLCSSLGWLLWQLLHRTVGRPIIRLTQTLRQWVTGVPIVVDRRKLRQLYHNAPHQRERPDAST